MPCTQVIKGWDEGVMGMQVGEKAALLCTPDYAYGEGGKLLFLFLVFLKFLPFLCGFTLNPLSRKASRRGGFFRRRR